MPAPCESATEWAASLPFSDESDRHCSGITKVLVLMASLCMSTSALSAAEGTRPLPLEAAQVAEQEPAKIKSLRQALQDRIEVTRGCQGVYISELRIDPATEKRFRTVRLMGRVKDVSQRLRVAAVFTDVVQRESFWATSDDEFRPDAESLSVQAPQSDVGKKALAQALDQIRLGKYTGVDELLTEALRDDPANTIVHYWKVAAEVALNRRDRAASRLDALLRDNPQIVQQFRGFPDWYQSKLRTDVNSMINDAQSRISAGQPSPPWPRY